MKDLKPGEAVYADGARAEFVKYLGDPYGTAGQQAIIRVGADTRVVGVVSLRRAS